MSIHAPTVTPVRLTNAATQRDAVEEINGMAAEITRGPAKSRISSVSWPMRSGIIPKLLISTSEHFATKLHPFSKRFPLCSDN